MSPRERYKKIIKKRQKDWVDGLNMGEFAGRFLLEWRGPGSFDYHPDPDDPFRYIRNKGAGKREVIQPEKMSTDGGSIPMIVQAVTGRTSWEYGPAYLIHDWEFHRHDVDRDFKKSFNQVNLTLAEAIWTLMNKGYLKKNKKPGKSHDAVRTIYSGVMSPVARDIWDREESG